MARLFVLGFSSPLLSKLNSKMFNVCIIWTCDGAIRVLANSVKFECLSELGELRLGWLGLPSSFLDIGAEQ